MASDSIRSAWMRLDPNRLEHVFEVVLGLIKIIITTNNNKNDL